MPEIAVQRMTGVNDPLVSGSIEPAREDKLNPAVGACSVSRRTGEREVVLRLIQDVGGSRGQVENQLRGGSSKPLPEIIPGGIGYCASYPSDETHVGAMLVKGKARLSVELVKGVRGRDNEADVVALMKLIGPVLVADTLDADEDG